MTKKMIHFNWGACGDWMLVRSKLKFLGVTLYGNFCDVKCDVEKTKRKIEDMGYKVTVEENPLLFRLADKEQPITAKDPRPTRGNPRTHYFR
jgi:hypothetical protein